MAASKASPRGTYAIDVTPEMQALFAEHTGLLSGILGGLEVPPEITPSQWAAENFVLSSDSAAEPGKFNPRRAAYQPGMMDAFVEPGVRKIVHMCSTQVGKTQVLLITIGYVATHKPAPMMYASGTKDMAVQFSTERLSPAIRDVPAMAKVFPPDDKRVKGNKLLYKKFPGGFLALAGANAPRTLRARSVKVALADEVDDWQGNAASEGDPLGLLEKRLMTFGPWGRLLVSSTPVDKYKSRVTRMYEESDQRRFFVPCPHCDHFQVLKWKIDKTSKSGYAPENIHWLPGKPETAVYSCEECGTDISDMQIKQAVRQGHWKATKPFNGVAGFHIWQLYSPFSSLADIVRYYEGAVGFTDRLKTFVTTYLGEAWEGQTIGSVELKTLMARREKTFIPGREFSKFDVPKFAGLLTAGIDVQHNRLELQVWAWGLNDERWLLSHEQLIGDPSGPRVWAELTERLVMPYTHEAGRKMWIAAAAVDSGGHHTQKVYQWGAMHLLTGKGWWPIKGVSGQGKPIWKISTISLKKGVNLVLVGVDAGKESVYAALSVKEGSNPNYCHLPMTFTKENIERLIVEKQVIELDNKGYGKAEWRKPEGAANEEFDCAVYAYAARMSLGVDIESYLLELNAVDKPAEREIDYAELARAFR